MEIFGWLVFVFGGSFVIGKTAAVALMFMRGGLETIYYALVAGGISALFWLAVTGYLAITYLY